MNHQTLKSLLYEQVARIGKALSSPKRLQILGLLAQHERSVESLAEEMDADIKLTSAHLKALKSACLVTSRREGKFIFYQLSGSDVAQLWVTLHQVAQTHLLELQNVLYSLTLEPRALTGINRETLLEKAQQQDIMVIDVRPYQEYHAGHLPFAHSLPISEISSRLEELPKDKEIVAYCRGPFCLLADQAIALLSAKGYRVTKLNDGILEWQAAGCALEYPANEIPTTEQSTTLKR